LTSAVSGRPLPWVSLRSSWRARTPNSSGRLCKIKSQFGQKLGLKEVDDGIWLVSFMHYDLGYFDLEQKTLQPLDNPFGTRLLPMS
jgi:hypothetical protein